MIKTSAFAAQISIAKVQRTYSNLMKAITNKELVSLAAIALIAPVLALAVFTSAGAFLASGYDVLLLALTLCGAVVSGINGFGRRTVRAEVPSHGSRRGPHSKVALMS